MQGGIEYEKKYILKISAVLIALMGFVLGMISNNVIAELFSKNFSLLGTLVATFVHIFVCILGFYLASKVENKTLRDYGMSWREGDGRHLIYGLMIGIVVFLFVTLTLYT